MTEENPVPVQQAPAKPPMSENEKMTHVIYLLQALALLFGITGLVAIILNYVKRNDVKGTILESHFTWQIRTFWIWLIAMVIGVLTMFILIGTLIILASYIWFLYRVVRGWLRLNDGKDMPNPKAFF